ncbi:helix-turn-helix domain-containing protein [Kribbella pittospori]|uniref:Helix-turn-helix domain-containing protein n=1 Tax=Kribbella pittospori TaxID=722689 RepID=A0A4R0JTW6_9ACTN|nr:helix-turn-helix domain-containing protein [Kribbella pittospori]TCC50399.1 helix-turn-helix domain-containing protein [Kribbella pittospori]
MDQERQWSMAEIPLRDRFGAWCEILASTHLAFAIDMVRGPQQNFAADVRENQLGEMSLLRTSVFPHRGRRTRRQVTANTRDVIGLHFIESGRQAVDLDGERVVLGPGDAMIWDGAATGGYEILEPLTKTTLIVPRSVAATALPGYRRSFVQTLPGDHAPTRSLVQVLSVLNDQLPTMSDGARAASALLVTELLRPLDQLQTGGTEPLRPWPALQLRERVLDYIDANLDDPKLSPPVIAAVHSVSVRTLYVAMGGLGISLGGYIRHRRLARSYDDLLFGSDPVGVVARRWGFASPAHFSRVFRERYGVAPVVLRRQRG